MSVAAGGPGGVAISPAKILGLGLLGLILIYTTPFLGPVFGPLLAAIGAVLAIIWGADTIRRVASYGLGTGVPSIGYMSLAIAIVGSIAGIAGASVLKLDPLLGPIFGFILAVVLGAIVAVLCKTLLKMKIPILIRGTAELSGAAALSVIGFSAAIAGTFSFAPIIVGGTLYLGIEQAVISTGFIALLFILNTMAIQHPFNACLGPDEDQVRTLKLSVATGFIAMAIVGLLSVYTSKAWWLVTLIGAIAWFIAIREFIDASKESAASVKWTGLWPKHEEE
ncbi:MAG: tetrahydromethanopterin S-methyltransferase subunit C [Euryarchaeota archaeon]|nr:tetrahydromethanopterin S-methyltransferase subunit C [Euryarchaeota archaeon]